MADREKKIMRRRLAGSYVSSVVSIALVLFLLGLAALLVGGAGSISDYFKESVRVSVILRQNVDEPAAEAYCGSIEALPCVKDARVVSREEGIREMKEMLGEDFLSVFQTAPIPISVDVSLKAAYVSSDSVAVVRKALSAPEVDEIEYQESMVEMLNSNIRRISLVLGVFIVLLLFISTVLIAGTVRLDVFTRRFNIHTMKMVGATRAFIRRPFLGRAVLQGLASAAVAIAALAAVVLVLMRSFPAAGGMFSPFMLAAVGVGVAVCGVLICVVSTWFVVNNLVSLRKDQLYF